MFPFKEILNTAKRKQTVESLLTCSKQFLVSSCFRRNEGCDKLDLSIRSLSMNNGHNWAQMLRVVLKIVRLVQKSFLKTFILGTFTYYNFGIPVNERNGIPVHITPCLC